MWASVHISSNNGFLFITHELPDSCSGIVNPNSKFGEEKLQLFGNVLLAVGEVAQLPTTCGR